MADDWDLNAVVRSCKSTTTANKTTSLVGDEAFTLDSLTLLQDQNNRYFSSPNNYNNNINHYEPTNNDAFQELQQFFSKPTFPDYHHNPTDSSNNNSIYILNSLSPDHDHLGASRPSIGQLQHQMQDQNGVVFSPQPQQDQRADHGEAKKKSNNLSRSVLLPRPLPLPPGYDASAPDPNLLLLSSIPTRPRKFRKNQLKKMVSTVTKENVHSDLWSWRKYGQKPIKGSPYPRNYYRCSSMKGCSARKQIERSRWNPELFVLTYTGEHRHCRPNHRNSLSGTTRSSKPLIPPPPPTALPSPPPQSAESAAAAANIVESEKGAEVDDLLIPNVVFSEDFFNDILI